MIKNPVFYSVIIGTEILNGRREDKHFEFIKNELIKRGWEQKACFIIKDDPLFMENVFNLVKNDPNSVMFSFGGIGGTPDDYTRQTAAKVFRNNKIEQNQEALKLIINQFGQSAYPHRVNMANLPKNALLLENIVNKVPGFGIDERFFFVPGFPEMAHHMVIEALDKFYPKNNKKYFCNFIVFAGESELIDTMKKLPLDLEFSSLPKFVGDKRKVEIYIADKDKKRVDTWCNFFKDEITKKNIKFEVLC